MQIFIRRFNLTSIDINLDIHNEVNTPNVPTGNDTEKNILKKFNDSILSIEKKFTLIELVKESYPEIVDNILRSQIVFLLSSVDLYLHLIINNGIINIIRKERTLTKEIKKCSISIVSLIEYLENTDLNQRIIENDINESNSFKTFLSPSKMKQGLSFISNQNIFKSLASTLQSKSVLKLEETLSLIYERRNSIAHQMDFSFATNQQQSITEAEVREYINFYKKFINELHILLIDDTLI